MMLIIRSYNYIHKIQCDFIHKCSKSIETESIFAKIEMNNK